MSLSAFAAIAVPWLLLLCGASGLLHGPVTFDERSLRIGGKPELILSGAVHYPRVHPGDWDRVFRLAKELGLNTIQTYVFWNVHERHPWERNNATWTGGADLIAFIRKAASYDMYISLRIGPFVCGEYYFGGIPVWVRNLGDIQCFRCKDPVWEAEMQRWVTDVIKKVKSELQPQGNIIMMQIENEYGGEQTYLDWAVDMAVKLTDGIPVPWNLCHAYHTCFRTNRRNGTYKFRALCAMNGFWMDEYDADPDQPSPKWVSDMRANNPGQPLLWTEDQGWFDQWEIAKRIRWSDDQLYGMARFFAYGGAYHNFYMLTGGNNYGLQAGGVTVTGYAPDTVISYLLLKHQPRYDYFVKFLSIIAKYKSVMLDAPVPATKILPTNGTAKVSHSVVVLPCTDTDPAHFGQLDASQRWDLDAGMLRTNFTGQPLCLDALQATSPPVLVPCTGADSQKWAYDSSTGHLSSAAKGPCQKKSMKGEQCFRCVDSDSKLTLWDCKQKADMSQDDQKWTLAQSEKGIRKKSDPGMCLSGQTEGGGSVELHEYGPVAFLSNTGAQPVRADFMGTSFTLGALSVSIVDKDLKKVVYNTAEGINPVNQDPDEVGSVRTDWVVFQESVGYGAKTVVSDGIVDQVNLTNNDHDHLWYKAVVPDGTKAADVTVTTADGSVAYVNVKGTELAILSTGMGFTNSGVGPELRKGITGVKVGHQPVRGPWTHSWLLEGEEKRIFTAEGTAAVQWAPYTSAHATLPRLWLKGIFDLPTDVAGTTDVSYALDLSSMWKGVAYVNGFHIGRFWLIPGQCSDSCAPPVKNGHCYMHWKDCGKPTQTVYHIPTEVLQPNGNLVVIFEEGPPGNARDPSSVRLLALAAPGALDSSIVVV